MGESFVLLADDDLGVRTFATVALQSADFIVLSAADAADALHMCHGNPRIDVLLTDVGMGDGRMNGFEVAALIMMEHPGISVVIMSGLPDNESTATEKGFLFVRKPFTATLLIDRVREALLRIPAQPETRTKSRQKAG